jgi:ABC-type glycerol-3-phosphate transport system substrate-binding protein
MRRLRALFLFLSLLLITLSQAQQTEIRMMAGAGYGIPPKEATATTALIRRAVFEEFHRQNPDLRVVNAGGLNLVGPQAENMFLMSMAGDLAPDVFYVNFRQYYTFLEQGFMRPLDDLIARNPEVLERANPTVMKVLTSFDGKVYAVPFFQVAVALYYRKDFFREAGLDPNRPPRDWDELYEYARKLTKKGRFGFSFSSPPGYHWQKALGHRQSGSGPGDRHVPPTDLAPGRGAAGRAEQHEPHRRHQSGQDRDVAQLHERRDAEPKRSTALGHRRRRPPRRSRRA